MNNNSLPLLAFVAVLAAAIFLPVGANAASIALTLTGVLAMLSADYGREMRPLAVRASIVPFEASHRAAELGRAA
jgi:hypothetical protein